VSCQDGAASGRCILLIEEACPSWRHHRLVTGPDRSAALKTAKLVGNYAARRGHTPSKNIIITEKATVSMEAWGQRTQGANTDKDCVDEENYTFRKASTVWQDTASRAMLPKVLRFSNPPRSLVAKS